MFAERLKQLRKERSLTQTEFAKLFRVAGGTVGMWETGKREPDFAMTQRLADFFGVSVDYLLGRDGERSAPLVNGDRELTDYLDMLRSRPECRMLFSVTKDATKPQIEAIVRMVEEMQKQG